jgi:hypothetical protein
MANSDFASNGLLGAGLLQSLTPAQMASVGVRLGQRQEGVNGAEWIFCLFPGGVTGPGYATGIDAAFNGTMITTANAGGQGLRVGIPAVAHAAGNYGWARVTGPCNAMLAAGTTARSQLNTTANPGVLGSDATAGSFKVNGITPIAAQASLGLGACMGGGGFITSTAN